MLKSIIDRTGDSSVNIFISDCVFSPPKEVPAKLYLVDQQLGIKTNFANKLNSLNFTTVVLRLTARFNGTFFNCSNQTTKIDAQRPYFIWIMGKHDYIKNLFEKVDRKKFKGGGVKDFYCLNNISIASNFAILDSPNFQRDKKNPRTRIVNAQKIAKGPHSGEFQISFGVNLTEALIDDDYILNSKNYTIPSNYDIEIKNSTITGYTHILTLTTKTLKPQILNIKLENKLPNWVLQANSEDDTQILRGNEMDKTFGIRNLIEGIFEAYLAKTPGGSSKPIFEFKISINQGSKY